MMITITTNNIWMFIIFIIVFISVYERIAFVFIGHEYLQNQSQRTDNPMANIGKFRPISTYYGLLFQIIRWLF